MSFVTTNLAKLIQKQTAFKLKAYYSVFTTLILLQLVAILFSFNAIEMTGGGTNTVSIYINYYSADIVIIFTMLWSFITAILITTRAYRNDEFTFVTNRVSSNLSNINFLLIASLVGGITALLSRYIPRVIMYYTLNIAPVKPSIVSETGSELLVGILATILYVLLFSAIGYFSGMLVQLHKVFIVLLPAAYIGFLYLGGKIRNNEGNAVIEFFGDESSFVIFIIKILVITALLFGSATALSNRLEVK